MINSVKKLKQVIDKRDSIMTEHCKGESWAELCNYPEERFWYTKNVSPLDEKIVDIANAVIVKFSIPCKNVKTVAEVYSNEWIYKLIFEDKEKQEEELSI